MSGVVGLIVGKFCPLHEGHQRLIEFGRARCDHLVLLSYTKPEFEGCGPDARTAWLAALYPEATRIVLDDGALAPLGRTLPQNEDPAEDHRAFVAWVCTALLGAPVDVVFTSEDYGDGFAASLTRHFGRPVRHIAFDPDRRLAPISGTAVRQDLWSHRARLHPIVAASFVRRIALIGGESSGKTSLAAALAEAFDTAWVPEYGREFWEAQGGRLSFEDLLRIAEAQIAREDTAARSARRYLFCDTTPLVTATYSRFMFGKVSPRLQDLAGRPYADTFLCAPDFPFVQDGTRRDAAFRQAQHEAYAAALTEAGTPFAIVSGPPEARIAQVRARLQASTRKRAAQPRP